MLTALPTTPDTPAVAVHIKTPLQRPLEVPAPVELPIKVETEVDLAAVEVEALAALVDLHLLVSQPEASAFQVPSQALQRFTAAVAAAVDTQSHPEPVEMAVAAQEV